MTGNISIEAQGHFRSFLGWELSVSYQPVDASLHPTPIAAGQRFYGGIAHEARCNRFDGFTDYTVRQVPTSLMSSGFSVPRCPSSVISPAGIPSLQPSQFRLL
jgi:hypothetical protein